MNFFKTKENVSLHYCVLFVVLCYVLFRSWSNFTNIVGIINFAVIFVYFLLRLIGKSDKKLEKYRLIYSIIMFLLLILNLISLALCFLTYDNITLYLCRILDCFLQFLIMLYVFLKILSSDSKVKKKNNNVLTFILSIASITVTFCVGVSVIIFISDVDLVFLIVECILTLLLRLLLVRYFSLS